jgi:hypothetical protein
VTSTHQEIELKLGARSNEKKQCELLTKLSVFVEPGEGHFLSVKKAKNLRFQFIPELEYKEDNYQLPLIANREVTCDVRRWKEGESATINFNNSSDSKRAVTIPLMVVVNHNDPSNKEYTITLEFRGLEFTPTQPLELREDAIVRHFQESQAFRSFKDIETPPVVMHQKTFLTLRKLQECLENTRFPSNTFTYVGCDTGENLLAVVKFLRRRKSDEFKLKIKWLPDWDRQFANRIDDELKTLPDGQVVTVSDGSETSPRSSLLSNLRGDVALFTFVLPWMSDENGAFNDEAFNHFLRFDMKSDTRCIFVNPTDLSLLCRAHEKANLENVDVLKRNDDLKKLNENQTFVHIEGIEGAVYHLGSLDTQRLNQPTQQNFTALMDALKALDTTLASSFPVYDINAFDEEQPIFQRANLTSRYRILEKMFEYTHDVFLLDVDHHPNLSEVSDLKGFRDIILTANEDSLTNQTLDSLHSRISRFKLQRHFENAERLPILMVVANGEQLKDQTKQIWQHLLNKLPDIRLCFINRRWSPEDMSASEQDRYFVEKPPSVVIQKAALRVIYDLLNEPNVLSFNDESVLSLSQEQSEFSVVHQHGNPNIFCYSWKFLFDLLRRVQDRGSYSLYSNDQHKETITQSQFDSLMELSRSNR